MIAKFIHKENLINNGGSYQKKTFIDLGIEPYFRGEILRGYNTVVSNESVSVNLGTETGSKVISDTEMDISYYDITETSSFSTAWTSKVKIAIVTKALEPVDSGYLFAFETLTNKYTVSFSNQVSDTDVILRDVTSTPTTIQTWTVTGKDYNVFIVEQLADETFNIFAKNSFTGAKSTLRTSFNTIMINSEAISLTPGSSNAGVGDLYKTCFYLYSNYTETELDHLFTETLSFSTNTMQEGLSFTSEEIFTEVDYPLECSAEEDYWQTPSGNFEFDLHDDLISNETKEVLANYLDYRAFIFDDDSLLTDKFSGYINSVVYNANTRIHSIDIIGAPSILAEAPTDTFNYIDSFTDFNFSNYRTFFDISEQENVLLIDIEQIAVASVETLSLNAGDWVVVSMIAIDETDPTQLSSADANLYYTEDRDGKRKILQKYYNTISLEMQVYNNEGSLSLRIDNAFVKSQWNYSNTPWWYTEDYWNTDFQIGIYGTIPGIPIIITCHSFINIIPIARTENTTAMFEIKPNYFGISQTNTSIQLQPPFGFTPTTELGNVDSIGFPNSPEGYFARLIGFANAYKDKYIEYLYPEDLMKRGFLTRIENIPKDLIVAGYDKDKITNFPESTLGMLANQQYTLYVKPYEANEWAYIKKEQVTEAVTNFRYGYLDYVISPVFKNNSGADTVRITMVALQQYYETSSSPDELTIATWYNSYSFDITNGIVAVSASNERNLEFEELESIGAGIWNHYSVWVNNKEGSNSCFDFFQTNSYSAGDITTIGNFRLGIVAGYLAEQIKTSVPTSSYLTFIGQNYILAEINWDKTVSGTTGEPLDSGVEYPAVDFTTLGGFQFGIYYTGVGLEELFFAQGAYSLMDIFKSYQVFFNTAVEYKAQNLIQEKNSSNFRKITYKTRFNLDQTPLTIELFNVTSEVIILDRDIISKALESLASNSNSNINYAIKKVEDFYKPLSSGLSNLIKGVYLDNEKLFLGKEVSYNGKIHYIIGITEQEESGYELNLLEKWDA